MKYNISKELFEAVMGKDYNSRLVDVLKCEEDSICTYYDCGSFNKKGEPTGLGYEILYDSFFFQCKEWALKQGYLLDSNFEGVCEVFNYNIRKSYKPKLADSEQQAVFDACSQILKWLKEQKHLKTK